MVINVLIIEDNPLTSQDLKEILQKNGIGVIGIAKNRAEAIRLFEANSPDVLLVDINLKDGDNGIDVANTINLTQSLPIVYLTAYSDKETVDKALNTSPAAYLTKPYDDTDVIIAIELAFKNHFSQILKDHKRQKTSFIFLKSANKFEKVSISSILYLQAEGSYTRFITKEKEYTLTGNLNTISEKVNNSSFLRTHRSYVVNIDNISGVDNNYIFIGDKNIPISRSYREEVNRVLQKIS